jgi:hypothetical protein
MLSDAEAERRTPACWRKSAPALSDSASLPLGLLPSHAQACQTSAKGAAAGGPPCVDVALVVTFGHAPWALRRATPLRSEQFLYGIWHTDQNHPEMQQWIHEGQTRRFLSPV